MKRVLLPLALMVAWLAPLQAQVVIADLRADYDAHGAFTAGATSLGANIVDTAGSGTWNFYSSQTLNPTSGGADLTLLTYATTANGVRAANAFVSLGNSGFDLPGWSNGVLITPGGSEGSPSANQLAVHPGDTGSGPIYAVASWTSGITGTVSLTGGFQDLGAVGGVEFAIFLNGSALVSSSITSGNTLIAFNETFAVTPGDKVYFMVGPNGGYGADQSALAATIAVPEPATWATWMAAGAGVTALVLRRRLGVSAT